VCGIIGYVGEREVKPILLNGLKKLEYRGYDSCGISVLSNKKIYTFKDVGRIKVLEDNMGDMPDSFIGIAHTRWATHGIVSKENAHPHVDCSNSISLVHNGIIENAAELRKYLEEKGHVFKSDTDTEVVAHLIEEFYNEKRDIEDAYFKALKLIEGAYAIVMIFKDEEKLFVAKKSSPLIVGVKDDGIIVASDSAPILPYTKNVIYLHDGDVAILKGNDYVIQNLARVNMNREVQKLMMDIEEINKGEFEHYMLKEIYEQIVSVENAFSGRIDKEELNAKFSGLNLSLEEIKNIKRIILTGCGTSWHACIYGKYLFEDLVGIPCQVEYASEFRYRNPILDNETLLIALSQSGETADTMAAVEEAKKQGAKTLGIVNVVGSSIARKVHGGVYLRAGHEIGVASTKTFTSHLVVLYLLALYFGRLREKITDEQAAKLIEDLERLPDLIREVLKSDKKIQKIAAKYFKTKNALYLGRGYNFPIALEGALKLKEISYIHAEGYPAAEMKHGPIALIDEDMPTVFIAPLDRLYKKILNNIEEVKTRGGKIIAITTDLNEELMEKVDDVIYVPGTSEYLMPILSVIPTQLLAYHIAVLRGCDVDKPRNLAKSVTVE
jgi:glucosamine--fructose-6-phosphate aminotransferase (isomerizing)